VSVALVTGGGGFIGRSLVGALLAEGRSVVVLDDFSNGARENLADLAGPLEVIEGSIDDERAVASAFRSSPELVLHLAARINVQHSIDDPVATFRVDVDGTLLVLEGARSAGAPFLFMSSCMVYAPAGAFAIGEEHPVRPASPYAASKLAGENLTLSYGLAYGHPVTVVRPFNTYGPFRASKMASVFASPARTATAPSVAKYADAASAPTSASR
jgi:nucleoside-diphosphate-sugar epimerase